MGAAEIRRRLDLARLRGQAEVIKAALILIGLLTIAAVIVLWFVSLISWDGIIPEHPYWDPEYDEDEERPEE